MSSAPTVLAVCVNWNGREVLPDLLESLLLNGYPALQALVVDNASQDGSERLVPDGVQLLRLARNQGYAGALNAALQRFFPVRNTDPRDAPSCPDYFLLLNNDLVLERGLIGKLVEFAQKNQAGVCGPKIVRYSRPGRLEAAWGEVSWSHVLARYRGKNSPDGPRWNQAKQVELLLGCLLLVQRDVFEQVGLFDERFFMYHEEVDFLFRCRQQEIPVYYCPCAQARHRGAHSTRRLPLQKTFWLRRNTVLFLRKHGAGAKAWARFFATLAASLAFNCITLRWRRAGAILRGVKEGWKSRLDSSSRLQ
ncbi:MAG: glycosyltransferase family 2 protein [Acidobacteriota bacterium]